MTLLLSTILAFSAVGAPPADQLAPTLVRAATARAPDGTSRVEIGKHHESIAEGCAITDAEIIGHLAGSGEAVFRLKGTDPNGNACVGWSWAAVRVFSQALVTSKSLAFGESLANAVTEGEHELSPGHSFLKTVAHDAIAALAIGSGTALEAKHVRAPGHVTGQTVEIEIKSGDLIVATTGTTVPCEQNAVCARLPSGKRVSGTWADGRLEVALP